MKKNVGRPRDSGLEERVYKAACKLYAKYGWAGFNMDKVAKHAKVGKGSLYLRWGNKAEILIGLVDSRTDFIAGIDTGNLRSDLIEFAHRWLDYMDTDNGVLTHRLTIDARFFPELQKALNKNPYPSYVKSTRLIIHKGIERGELPANTSIALVADLIAGAVSNHIRNTPKHILHDPSHNLHAYINNIVDTVLTGVSGYIEQSKQTKQEQPAPTRAQT